MDYYLLLESEARGAEKCGPFTREDADHWRDLYTSTGGYTRVEVVPKVGIDKSLEEASEVQDAIDAAAEIAVKIPAPELGPIQRRLAAIMKTPKKPHG